LQFQNNISRTQNRNLWYFFIAFGGGGILCVPLGLKRKFGNRYISCCPRSIQLYNEKFQTSYTRDTDVVQKTLIDKHRRLHPVISESWDSCFTKLPSLGKNATIAATFLSKVHHIVLHFLQKCCCSCGIFAWFIAPWKIVFATFTYDSSTLVKTQRRTGYSNI
jgi:hypothetical protein